MGRTWRLPRIGSPDRTDESPGRIGYARPAPRPAPATTTAVSPEWALILDALGSFCGNDHLVLYDVPRDQAPARLPGTPIFLHGSPAWEAYLRVREQHDVGEPTLLLALRPLPDAERLLAIDWGNTYANTFLLVEPRNPDCDLTDPANPFRRSLETAARAALDLRQGRRVRQSLRGAAVDAIVRDLYGVWVVWDGPPSMGGAVERHVLPRAQPGETLPHLLLPRLRGRFPQHNFEQALAALLDGESELFGGRPVARARTPFLTRLGLPVPENPRRIDRALRTLINAGQAWVYEPQADGVSYHGPSHPIPETMTDEEFERLIM